MLTARGGPLRAAARFAASVMIVSGGLLIGDAAMTLAMHTVAALGSTLPCIWLWLTDRPSRPAI